MGKTIKIKKVERISLAKVLVDISSV